MLSRLLQFVVNIVYIRNHSPRPSPTALIKDEEGSEAKSNSKENFSDAK